MERLRALYFVCGQVTQGTLIVELEGVVASAEWHFQGANYP